MNTIKALIIDDIALARQVLRKDIENSCPEIEVLGEADSVLSALKFLQSNPVDLLFLDIHLPDGIGFDLLDVLAHPLPKVIFTTASDEYAIEAFRVAAIDYLLKPIDPELLQKAVKKLVTSKSTSTEHWSKLKKNSSHTDRLALHTNEQIVLIQISEIIRCEADGNYTQFFLWDKKPVLVSKTLKEFDQQLTEYGFLRTHQSHLVNTQYVQAYIKTEGGYLLMKDQSRIPISIRKKAKIVQAISNIG